VAPLILVLALNVSSGYAAPYRIVQSVPVASNISLLMLEDANLPMSYQPDFLDPNSSKSEPLPAKLVLINRGGQKNLNLTRNGVGRIHANEFVYSQNAAQGRIEPTRLGGAYLVMFDDSAGFGSYSGQETVLFDLRGGRLERVTARGDNGVAVPITLGNRLKSAWRIANAREGEETIEWVDCKPIFPRSDLKSTRADFLTTFTTYRLTDGIWHYRSRTVPGYWESEGDFPAHSQFP
jgi:hypothetical protein